MKRRMARLIDADELLKQRFDIRIEINKGDNHYSSVVYADDIDDCQTIDAEPVKHGKWERRDDDIDNLVVCTACGEEFVCNELDIIEDLDYKYCPYCGAKMDGGENE